MHRLCFVLPLILSILACSLTSNEEQEPVTPTPTAQLIGQPNLTTVTATMGSTVTPRPTTTSAPTVQPTPSCSLRTDWATITVQVGDTLFSIAQRSGTNVNALVQANCLANANAIQVGQTLYVPVVIPPTLGSGSTPILATSTSLTACSNLWFFTFNTTITESRCPDLLIATKAAAQDFEGGRVFWYDRGGKYSVPQIYVAFNNGGWSVYGDEWNPSLPFDDPSIIPPTGRFQPVAGIGYLWRTQPGLRDRLGWAYENEQAFTGRRQEPLYPLGNTQTDLYLDYGKQGLVLRLSQGFTWVTAGRYTQ